MADSKLEEFETLTVSSSIRRNDLMEQLRKLTASLSPQDLDATLSTLRRIFGNISQHPNDDKYRQIKLAGKTFSSKVWQYPTGQQLMKMSGWVVEGDYVRQKDDSCVQIMAELLQHELNIAPKGFSASMLDTCHGDKSVESSNSSNRFSPPRDITFSILFAIVNGNGVDLKDVLKQYDTGSIKNMQIDRTPIISFAYLSRQIGIARILINKYGIDTNISAEDGQPHFLVIFDGCNSTESCQSLIIQFIKEFDIDINRCITRVWYLVMMHKLFTIVKFLVEDYKVDVNCICSNEARGGTPLHMAYGIGEENIALYLIDHGADQEIIDDDGKKPIDHKLCESVAALVSKYYLKKRAICKAYISSEYVHYKNLCHQGISEFEAVDLTFKKFPSLQKCVDGDRRICEAVPTLNELSRYITDMAPSYYHIGLHLGITSGQLKVIENDPSLCDLKQKCRKMLEVWLENDTSGTWKTLCDALQGEGLSVLAEQIKNSQQ